MNVTLGELVDLIVKLNLAEEDLGEAQYSLAWCDKDAPAYSELARRLENKKRIYHTLRDTIIFKEEGIE